MTIYILDVLLFLFVTSLFFHVQFLLLLPDPHTGFSRGRSGGWSDISISFGIFQFIMIHTVKAFGIVNKAEIVVFLGYPLQYSCMENSMDRGTWLATVHGVTESDMT